MKQELKTKKEKELEHLAQRMNRTGETEEYLQAIAPLDEISNKLRTNTDLTETDKKQYALITILVKKLTGVHTSATEATRLVLMA